MTEQVASPSLEEFLARLADLPALPAVLADLIVSLDDERLGLDQIAGKISHDPALAGRTLRIANSPFFGLAGRIASIQEAATLLGLQTIRSIALTSALKNVTSQSPAVDPQIINWFWLHAVQTASAAQRIAGMVQVPTEQAFVAGLLHDIGKFSLAVLYPERYAAVEAYCLEHQLAWSTAESALGIPSHAVIGGAIARLWRFPPQLCEVLTSYSAPSNAEPLTQVVHVANAVANAFAAVSHRGIHVERIDPAAWRFAIRNDRSLGSVMHTVRKAKSLVSTMTEPVQ